MGYLHSCLMCGEKIDSNLLECPYCGEKQYGDNNEFYPNKSTMKAAKTLVQREQSGGLLGRILGGNKKQTAVLSEEECLLYGVHPDDETYRNTIELDVLSRNYKQ